MEAIEWILRIFGVFWMVGGVFAFKKALQVRLMDSILDALSNKKESRLVQYYGYAVSILTFLSGAGLALLHPYASYALLLLVLTQGLYFALQRRRYNQATNEEERMDATVAYQSKNAFYLSIVVLAMTLTVQIS